MEQLFPGSRYGEITDKGTKKLIQIFKTYFSKPHIFYDLGSGKGDLSINIAKLTNVSKVYGIELHKERYNTSLKKLKNEDIDNVFFINKNILDIDLSNADIVYFSNEAIPKNVSHKIWDKIPKGCLFICSRRIKNSETRKKYKWTEPIEKKCISDEKWIYFSKSQKYIIKE